MAKFDPYIRQIITKIYDDNFVDEIIELTNEIFPLIINGEIPVFESNYQNNELLSSLQLYDLEFYKTLTFDKDINGVRNKTGFNRLTILSTFLDQDVQQFLNDVPNDFLQASIQLDQINKGFDSNLRYFKYINQIVQGYDKFLINLCDDKNIAYRLFNYLFNRITDITDSGKISFVYLYSFMVLYQGYSRLIRYQSHIYYHIIDNNRLTPEYLAGEFRLYFDNHQTDIVNTIGSYCYRNVFAFSDDYTVLFDTVVDDEVNNSISRLIGLFEDNVREFTSGTDFLTILLAECVEQTSLYTTTKRLDDFYVWQNLLYDPTVFGVLELEEDAIYETIRSYVQETISDLENIEYVAWQFNHVPIYFMNSYTELHAQYSSNLNDAMKIPFKIDDWDAKLVYREHRNLRFKEFLDTNRFIYDSKVTQRTSYYLFADLISNFMDSEYVTRWIIGDFFPALLHGVNVNYLKNIDVYKYVDHVRWVIRLLLIKDIFEGKSFVNYITTIDNYMSSNIDRDYDTNFSDVTVDLIFNNYPKDQIEKLLNGICKSTYVNNYLNALTSKYSI